MSTNLNVGSGENSNIAGRDINMHVHHHAPNQSESSGNIHELGKNAFSFRAVSMSVCVVLHINKVDTCESAKFEFKLKHQLNKLTTTH